MHDVLESLCTCMCMSRIHDYVRAGSLALCVKHLLIQLIIKERVFSLELLNDCLGSFNFGSTQNKNRPSKIASHHLSSESTLKQSAGCTYMYLRTCTMYMPTFPLFFHAPFVYLLQPARWGVWDIFFLF